MQKSRIFILKTVIISSRRRKTFHITLKVTWKLPGIIELGCLVGSGASCEWVADLGIGAEINVAMGNKNMVIAGGKPGTSSTM